MVNKDFFQALKDLEEQEGIKQEYFIDALESALTSAYKKNFGEAKSAYLKNSFIIVIAFICSYFAFLLLRS